jgi:aspartate 1-decarboxylase
MRKAKIHRATVTQADLNYEGSVTIDQTLMEAAGLVEEEKVLVVNVSTGDRFETYALTGPPDSGVICLNGGCARLGAPGDVVLIISFAFCEDSEVENWEATTVHVDQQNRIVRRSVPRIRATG